ncbi:MAG TPA: hypothetical protein VIS30_05865, partial [Candidatus Deferrimicrobiaceae bacterium]
GIDLLRDVASADAAEMERTEIPERVSELAARRARLRSERDFRGADALREEIRTAGYEVADAPDGTFRLEKR